MVLGLSISRFLEGLSLVQQVSLALSCPFHCGSSGLPWLLIGLLCGLLIGFGLSAAAFLYLHRNLHPPTVPSGSASTARSTSSAVRLRGYLHEHQQWSTSGSPTGCATLAAFCGFPVRPSGCYRGKAWPGSRTLGGCWGLLWSPCSCSLSFQYHVSWHSSCPPFLCGEVVVCRSGPRCSCKACLWSWISCKAEPRQRLLVRWSQDHAAYQRHCLGCSPGPWT